ncbi:MAG: hypothetical protein WD971_03560 [Pirellulales bacterium]
MKGIFLSIIVAVGVLSAGAQDAAAARRTEFYRVAEVDGAWWFIAPDGNRLFSSGVNVVDVGGTREKYDPQRPEYAALRHYPDRAAWAAATNERFAAWGFNTVGGWSAEEMMTGPLPYTAVLHLGRELGVPWNDLLDPRFAEQVAAVAEQKVSRRADDPRLIGWYTDNELSWFADTLFGFHIAQPAKSFTRQALVNLLRKKYGDDFARLEQDFVAVKATSFDELDAGGTLLLRPGGRGMEVADSFLRLVAERFYQTAHDAIRRNDPHHLILGDRYHGYCPDVVAEAAAPYVDVISTNFDQPDWTDGQLPAFYLERLHQLTGRPILVTEYYAAAHDNRSGNKNTGNIFTTVGTQRQRAAAVGTRLSSLASLRYVVGAHWFQFSDEPTHGRRDGEDYNFGLVDIENRPYEELVTVFAKTNAAAPRLHAAAGLAPRKKNTESLTVPAAPADPLSGIADWDQSLALVPCNEPSSLGDLLVSCDAGRVYLALGCSTYVDSDAYADQQSAKRDRLVWRIALGDGPPIRVSFGVGDEVTVSDRAVDSRLHQRGLRYTVIVAVPREHFDREASRKGDRVRLAASLEDARRGARTTWTAQLDFDGELREALSQPDTRSH